MHLDHTAKEELSCALSCHYGGSGDKMNPFTHSIDNHQGCIVTPASLRQLGYEVEGHAAPSAFRDL
jgi:hypothetical protein